MKPINPLYTALLLIAVFLVVLFKLHQANVAHGEAVASLYDTETMAKRTAALKASWDDETKNAAALKRLMSSALLRDADAHVEKQSDLMVISVKSIDRKGLEYLINKLLNGTYRIKNLKVERLDEDQASLYAEVAL